MHELPSTKFSLVAQALIKESDRGCVILSAALLAETLEELLRSVGRQEPGIIKSDVNRLFQGYAPLATFSARIDLAFALGFLPRSLRNKIQIIRRMRNDFAHEWGPIDFSDPRCASRLRALIGPGEKSPEDEQQEQALTGLAGLAPSKEQLVLRIALALAVSAIIGRIESLIKYAKEGRDIRPIVLFMEQDEMQQEQIPNGQ